MVKILEHRRKAKIKRIKCDCGCKFEFDLEAEAKYNSDQRDGDYYSIRCPECKELHTWAV